MKLSFMATYVFVDQPWLPMMENCLNVGQFTTTWRVSLITEYTLKICSCVVKEWYMMLSWWCALVYVHVWITELELWSKYQYGYFTVQNRVYKKIELYDLRNYFGDKIIIKSWWANSKDDILLWESTEEGFINMFDISK